MKYLILLFLTTSITTYASEDQRSPYYFEVTAQNGDGIYSLLRRYELLGPECNLHFFLRENSLSLEDQLIVGRKYKIPVLIYRYNGVSIRSTIDDSDWDKAVRIKQYNEKILANGLRSTSYLKSHILWVPHHEMSCGNQLPEQIADPESDENLVVATKDEENTPITAAKPVSLKSLTVPMFGPAHETVYLKSEKLAGKVYYLVSGHGGPDPGAMAHKVDGSYTLCEDEYAYDVTLRLAKRLMEQGAIVHMLIEDPNDGIREVMYLDCDNDEKSLGKDHIPLSQKLRLRQRTNEINKLYKKHQRQGVTEQVVLSIHVDSRSESLRQDVFFYYYSESNSGKNLATRLKSTFENKYREYQGPHRNYDGSVSSRPLFILKYSWPTAVFVELANIRNAHDRKRILDPNNRQYLADWLYEGLIN